MHKKLLSFTACKNELFGIWQASKMNFCWFWECSNNTLVVFENDFKVSLFYYLTYFCYYLIYFYYYSWILLYFLVLFISFIVLFQLSFTFTYRIYSKKISVLTKQVIFKQIPLFKFFVGYTRVKNKGKILVKCLVVLNPSPWNLHFFLLHINIQTDKYTECIRTNTSPNIKTIYYL